MKFESTKLGNRPRFRIRNGFLHGENTASEDESKLIRARRKFLCCDAIREEALTSYLGTREKVWENVDDGYYGEQKHE